MSFSNQMSFPVTAKTLRNRRRRNRRKLAKMPTIEVMELTSRPTPTQRGIRSNLRGATRKSSARSRMNPQAVVRRDIPLAQSFSTRSVGPRFQSGRNGTTLISHREFVKTLEPSDSADKYESYLINPANKDLFPWLGTMAENWERTRFTRLSMHYVPNCAMTFAGDMGMMIDYDPKDPDADSYGEFTNSKGAVTSAFVSPVVLQADVSMMDVKNKGFYLNTGSPQTEDLGEYYPGKFQIYMSKAATPTVVGRLFVEYEVEMKTPQGHKDSALTNFVLTGEQEVANSVPLFATYLAGAGTIHEFSGTDWTCSDDGFVCYRGGQYVIQVNLESAGYSNETYTDSGTCTIENEVWDEMYALLIVTATSGQTFEFTCNGTLTYTEMDVAFVRSFFDL